MIATNHYQKNPSNHSSKSGNLSSRSLGAHLAAGGGKGGGVKSPFMYGARDDESVLGLDMTLLGAESDYSTDCSTDYYGSSSDDDSASSFASGYTMDSGLLDHDDDLDELEKALEVYAYKEERQAAKEVKKKKALRKTRSLEEGERRGSIYAEEKKQKAHTLRKQRSLDKDFAPPARAAHAATSTTSSRTSTAGSGGPEPAYKRQNSNGSQDSHKSNKSLPLSALMDNAGGTTGTGGKNRRVSRSNRRASATTGRGGRRNSALVTASSMSSSNRSLSSSLSSPKDKLDEIFFSSSSTSTTTTTSSPSSSSLASSSDFEKFCWDDYFEDSCPDTIGTMRPELERAVKSRNLKRLIRLVDEKGIPITSRNNQGETIAHLVCREGQQDMLLYITQECGVSLRCRDSLGRTPLHDIAWNPTFNPSVAMMLISDSPELLWAPDARGYIPMDYIPKQAIRDWYDFFDVKEPMLKLALQFSRFKATSKELNANQERLQEILERHLQHKK